MPAAVLLTMLSPFGPPPPKQAVAQKPPVLKPADPFDDINMVKKNPKVRIDTIGSMPVILGIAEHK